MKIQYSIKKKLEKGEKKKEIKHYKEILGDKFVSNKS